MLRLPNQKINVDKAQSWSDFRAWCASCLFHTTLLVLFAILWRPQSRSTSGELESPVAIAVLNQTSDVTQYSLEGGSSGSTGSNAGGPKSVPMTIENEAGPPISIESIVSELVGTQTGPAETGASGSQGNGLAGDSGLGSGKGNGNGKGNGSGKGQKTKTTFFGVEGLGKSFVYVIDRSDSMNSYGAAPLRFAKREVLKSLESLTEFNQFQIVFYNDSLAPMSRGLLFAEDKNKRKATEFVRNMPGDGSTAHFPALRQGLSMVPEVLFFLTDADDPILSMPQLLEIQRRAELSGTTIHSIQFNVGPATSDGSWIRELAEMNRGTYSYIDVTSINTLPDK